MARAALNAVTRVWCSGETASAKADCLSCRRGMVDSAVVSRSPHLLQYRLLVVVMITKELSHGGSAVVAAP